MAPRHAAAEGGGVTGTPFWLDLKPEPIFGVLHTPSSTGRVPIGALILPTFGWDNDCSYRARRDWATALAESGVPTVRIDFPGTENSVGSPIGPDRVQSWIDAVLSTAQWLRQRSQCDRLVVIGIGLGGLIAHQAVAAGAVIDDLVLWGVPAKGRSYVRELRAYGAVVGGQFAEPPAATDNAGVIEIGGYPMSEQTAEALSGINLTEGPLPQAQLRRVLLIGRDAHGVDEKLRVSLSESGATVSVLDSDDYRSLVAPPEYGMRPTKTISDSVQWLLHPYRGSRDRIQHADVSEVPEAVDSVLFDCDGANIGERLCSVDTPGGRVEGIISEPANRAHASHCLVAINAGALRHTGPNRMVVELTRRAAASGVPAVRFDLPGLGDSDGKASNVFEYGPENDVASLVVVRRVCDHLQRLGVADRFVTTGVSLGGNLAVRATLQDERVIGAIGINAPALGFTDRPISLARSRAVMYAGLDAMAAGRSGQRLPRPLRGIANRASLARQTVDVRLRARLAPIDFLWRLSHRADVGELSRGLEELGDAGARILLLLGTTEWMVRLVAQPKLAETLGRSPNIKIEQLACSDHLLRPLWVQKKIIDRVIRASQEFDPVAAPTVSSQRLET